MPDKTALLILSVFILETQISESYRSEISAQNHSIKVGGNYTLKISAKFESSTWEIYP